MRPIYYLFENEQCVLPSDLIGVLLEFHTFKIDLNRAVKKQCKLRRLERYWQTQMDELRAEMEQDYWEEFK